VSKNALLKYAVVACIAAWVGLFFRPHWVEADETPQQPKLYLVGDYRQSTSEGRTSAYGLTVHWFRDVDGTECYVTRDYFYNAMGGGISCHWK
jgi:hypothetical protein